MKEPRAIELTSMNNDDFDRTFVWLQDTALRAAVDCLTAPADRETNLRYWLSRQGRSDEVNFALRLEGEHVGNAGIRCIDHLRGIGEVYLYLAPGRAGSGNGKAAGNLLLLTGFNELGLRRLSARVLSTNSRALAFWKDLGFRVEGCARGATLDEAGKSVDVELLGLLAQEASLDWKETVSV